MSIERTLGKGEVQLGIIEGREGSTMGLRISGDREHKDFPRLKPDDLVLWFDDPAHLEFVGQWIIDRAEALKARKP